MIETVAYKHVRILLSHLLGKGPSADKVIGDNAQDRKEGDGLIVLEQRSTGQGRRRERARGRVGMRRGLGRRRHRVGLQTDKTITLHTTLEPAAGQDRLSRMKYPTPVSRRPDRDAVGLCNGADSG